MKSGVPLPPGPEGHRLVACNKFFRDTLEAVRKKYPSWEHSDNFFRGTYVIDWKKYISRSHQAQNSLSHFCSISDDQDIADNCPGDTAQDHE